MAAGSNFTPFEIVITAGSSSIMLSNIVHGDVYVCSGALGELATFPLSEFFMPVRPEQHGDSRLRQPQRLG